MKRRSETSLLFLSLRDTFGFSIFLVLEVLKFEGSLGKLGEVHYLLYLCSQKV